MANKKYYDRIHNVASSENSEFSQSTSKVRSYNKKDRCNEQHNIDSDIVNTTTNHVLQSIRDHIASSTVIKRFNKDIAKKLRTNRKTVNPPLSVIAPCESCNYLFKNLHYQPLSHT